MTSRPSSIARLSPRSSLLVLKLALNWPRLNAGWPPLNGDTVRELSGRETDSTRITVAPKSARYRIVSGPTPIQDKSRTFRPLKTMGSAIRAAPLPPRCGQSYHRPLADDDLSDHAGVGVAGDGADHGVLAGTLEGEAFEHGDAGAHLSLDAGAGYVERMAYVGGGEPEADKLAGLDLDNAGPELEVPQIDLDAAFAGLRCREINSVAR